GDVPDRSRDIDVHHNDAGRQDQTGREESGGRPGRPPHLERLLGRPVRPAGAHPRCDATEQGKEDAESDDEPGHAVPPDASTPKGGSARRAPPLRLSPINPLPNPTPTLNL